MTRPLFIRPCLLLAFCTLLVACAAKPLPQERHFSLIVPTVATAATAATGMIVVEPVRVSGVFAERAIVYSNDSDGLGLQQYHYALWAEPPAQLVQRSLIDYLRSTGLATTVAGEAGRARPDLRIQGRINRFERRTEGSGWKAVVEIELRADSSTGTIPEVVRNYSVSVAAADGTMESSVRAFGEALAQNYAAFAQELRTAVTAPRS